MTQCKYRQKKKNENETRQKKLYLQKLSLFGAIFLVVGPILFLTGRTAVNNRLEEHARVHKNTHSTQKHILMTSKYK